MSRALTLLALVLLFLAGACNTNMNYVEHMTSLPPTRAQNLPRIQVDREASMIALTDTSDTEGMPRDQILAGVEAFWNEKANLSGVRPARVLITGRAHRNLGYLALCLLLPPTFGPFLGVPCASGESQVEVVVEVKGSRRVTGSGVGKCWESWYYYGDAAQCALSKAVADALRKATLEVE